MSYGSVLEVIYSFLVPGGFKICLPTAPSENVLVSVVLTIFEGTYIRSWISIKYGLEADTLLKNEFSKCQSLVLEF